MLDSCSHTIVCAFYPKQTVYPFKVYQVTHNHKIISYYPGMQSKVIKIMVLFASRHCYAKVFVVVTVQALSCVRFFAIPWTAARQASPSPSISQSLPKFMTIELVLPSKHLILCHPLLLLPSIFPASESFPVSWLFTSDQSIGASASGSVLPVNIQG